MKTLILTLILTLNVSHLYGANDHRVMKMNENKNFNELLLTYEKLHQSFFDNDNSKINKATVEVLKSLEKIKNKKIKETLTYSKKKLEDIIKSEDIEANHNSFNTASQGILIVLDKYSYNKKYARYFCPMVKKYWIQNISKSEKVMNPYASLTMPHCGTRK
jgi:hypothetical protein